MNAWFVAALALLVGIIPLLVVAATADVLSRLVALEVAGVQGSLTLVCLAQAFDRSSYSDLGLVLAVLSIVTGLTYARVVERYL